MAKEIIKRQEGIEELRDETRDTLSELRNETELHVEKKKVKDISEKDYNDLCLREKLTDKQLQQVVNFSNKNDRILNLWLTRITDNQAKILSEAFRINLNWLTSITNDQLEILSKKEGHLGLDWLKYLTDAQILLLSRIERLSLNWLKFLSNEQILLLLSWNVEILSLNWLEYILDTQAKLLSKVRILNINESILTPRQREILWRE